MPKVAKMRYCFNCGEELGCYADYDPLDDCGKMECTRAARDAHQQQYEEAREEFDRGWGRW
jgi:hypothetical protein